MRLFKKPFMVKKNISGINKNIKIDNKTRNEFFIFLLCLLLSALSWLMIELSKEYTIEFTFPLKYINTEKRNLLISEAPDNMSAYITANGYKIIKMKYFETLDTLLLDVTKVKINQSNNKTYTGWAKARDVVAFNQRKLYNKKINATKTDTLFITFTKAAYKQVKVSPDLNLVFAKGYEQADSIIIEPKTVNIKGFDSVISKIDFIKTEYCKIKNITSNKKIYLKLLPPDKNIFISPDSVKIIIPVKKTK